MKLRLIVPAVALGGLFVAGCTSTSGNDAFAVRKATSDRICTSAVANRTGSNNLSIYRSISQENYRSVWIDVDGGSSQYYCVVEKNGPDSYYINTVRKL